MEWLYFLTIFLAVAVCVVTGYLAFVDFRERDQRRAAERAVGLRKDAPAPDSPALFDGIPDLGASAPSGPWIDRAFLSGLLRRDWLRPLRKALDRAALKWQAGYVVAACLGLAVAAGGLGWAAQGPLLGVPALIAGAVGPVVYVETCGRARRERFLSQLAGAFELMARVIRSGQSVPQAFQAVADSFEDPIAAAFARCRDQQNMGLPPEAAFQELAERSGVLDMRIFVMAMMIQRNAGGNLSEVLERLAALVRERRRVRQQVKTLTAEGRLQAGILLILPFFMLVAMRFVNRAYADELFQHTGLLAATAVSMGVGALWIRKIIDIDV